VDLNKILNNPKDPLSRLDSSNNSPTPNKPIIPTNSTKSKPIILINPT
jgi:hypothetical protein